MNSINKTTLENFIFELSDVNDDDEFLLLLRILLIIENKDEEVIDDIINTIIKTSSRFNKPTHERDAMIISKQKIYCQSIMKNFK
jgi:hypothetical protein